MKFTPQSSYTDHFEISRFELTFHINVFMGILLPILAAFFYVLDQPAFYPTLYGILVIWGLLALLFFTRKYKVSAIIYSSAGIILTNYTIIAYNTTYHFADPLWMIIVSLFTYFTLGKIAGHITMLAQFAGIAYFLLYNVNDNLMNPTQLPPTQVYALVINVSSCGLIIAYLISQFIKRNAFAVESYKKITIELQSKNELVEKQNDEKTAMLKEIHHRVKNNLQVITSLLRLQARDINTPKAVEHFDEAVDRIAAMALIHNKMYQSSEINKINLKGYLETLSDNILKSYSIHIPIQSHFDIRIEYAPPNTIVPIALLFNELISNSLKHGFENRKNGEINVIIKENKRNNSLVLIYADNGIWKQPRRADSFGLELIDTLVHQLNGSFERDISDGTSYVFNLHPDP